MALLEQPTGVLGDDSRGETRLACFFLPGCVSCEGMRPVAELLASRSTPVEFVDCSVDYDALLHHGGESTPYWCLLEGDTVVKSLYPADDTAELFAFVTELDADISRESFNEAIAEGSRKAAFLEACQAELALRSPETDATDLMGAARIKIGRPCLSPAAGEDVRTCVERTAANLEERLQERIAMPGGDTAARREVIERLPELIDELSAEIEEILEEARRGKAKE